MTAGHGPVHETEKEISSVEAESGSNLPHGEDASKGSALESKSPFQIAMARLREDKIAITCAIVVLLLILMGIFAPLLAGLEGQDPTKANYDLIGEDNLPTFYVNGSHWLGVTTNTGYDVFARFVYGIRPSFLIAVSAAVLTTLIGVVLGIVAGFFRGWVDQLIGWLVDFVLCLPLLVMVIALVPILTNATVGPQATGGQVQTVRVTVMMLVLVFLGWAQLCRLVRGEVLSLRQREFVQAARALGAPTRRVLFKEILPNLTGIILVQVTSAIPVYIGIEAGLSYLGIGLTAPTADWGLDISLAQAQMQNFALPLIVPLVGVLITVLCLSLLGDAVSDAFNPNTRR